MKHLWIIILVIFGIGQIVEHCNALQHNLFYGNCAFDNNTMPIYTQVVSMENLRPPSADKPRKWYDYILHPFGRRTTPPPQPPSFGHGSTINTTIVYPPLGHKNLHLIKCIQVIDNNHDGSGAIASIIEGGVNQNHTKILLKSQPGGKINNKITIFAYRQPVLPYQHTPIGWKTPLSPPFPANTDGIHQSQPQARPQKSYFPWPHFHKKK